VNPFALNAVTETTLTARTMVGEALNRPFRLNELRTSEQVLRHYSSALSLCIEGSGRASPRVFGLATDASLLHVIVIGA